LDIRSPAPVTAATGWRSLESIRFRLDRMYLITHRAVRPRVIPKRDPGAETPCRGNDQGLQRHGAADLIRDANNSLRGQRSFANDGIESERFVFAYLNKE
jgi:hypothetical protein